jgi:hypothetical protein
MKPRHFSGLTSSSIVRPLLRLTIALCLIATPLFAQSTGQASQPQVAVVVPQLSQLNAATLQASNLPGTFITHYGTVIELGYFTTAGGREVVIVWDSGGASRQQGGISDAQWEIFKLAFAGTGRIYVLSDFVSNWQFDLRFLAAQR